MNIKFDYYIRRKSDNKLMQILHAELSEDEIIEAVKENLTAPMHYDMDTDNEDGKYAFSDISISEVTGLS